jgi:hypothetical protein
MEREGEESSGEQSQAAEGEQSRVAEKRRVIMAVTRILDSGTLDEKSSGCWNSWRTASSAHRQG